MKLTHEMILPFTEETKAKEKEIQLIAEKYLSEEVKALPNNPDVVILEDGQNALREDIAYRGAYISYTVKENETLEEGVMNICIMINDAVRNKWIEKANLGTVHHMELINGRTFLMHFGFSRYTLKELKEMSGSFKEEGHLIDPENNL